MIFPDNSAIVLSMKKKTLIILTILILALLISACSINRVAVRALGSALSGAGGGDLFTGDNDPELIGDALPFALKIYEALISQDPKNTDLLLTAGTGFVSYANAFVHTPASMLPDEMYKQQKEMYFRAKNLYMRGKNYALASLDSQNKGFKAALEEGDIETVYSLLDKKDLSALYWAGAGWMGAISMDLFDFQTTLESYKAVALMVKALDLDETYGQGSVHEFLITLYGSMPENMMFRPYDPDKGDIVRDTLAGYYNTHSPESKTAKEKALHHFNRSLELSAGQKASVYVSYATAFSKKNETPEEYISMLKKALEIDPDAVPENRLMNILSQRKARYLLDHIEDAFPFYED